MKRLIILSFIAASTYSVMAQSKDTLENEHSFLSKVLSEKVCFADRQIETDSLEWHPHPTFKGVYLKHLVLGKDTNGQLSCHIVKIEPNCILDTHLHDGKIEIHEVVGGSGMMLLDGKEINYSLGKICVIPANTLHKVVANEDGLYLFAKFSSALQ